MSDLIERQAAIDAIYNVYDKYDRNAKVEELASAIQWLPFAQPEIKPIDYQDCANAMLRMWMDKVITDGEYNRIINKLNVFWRAKT